MSRQKTVPVSVLIMSHSETGNIPSYPHRSCNISLLCFFHWSLKSVENSCQTEKKVLRETSFSPALGLTEKDTLNSKKLRTENNNITPKPNYYNMRDYRNLHNCCKLGVVGRYVRYESYSWYNMLVQPYNSRVTQKHKPMITVLLWKQWTQNGMTPTKAA